MLGNKTPNMSFARYMMLYGLQVTSPALFHLILIKVPRDRRSNTMIPILQMRKPRLRGYQLTQANPMQLVGGSASIQTPTPGSNPIPVFWSRMCKKRFSEPVSEPWPLCSEPWEGRQSPTFWQLWPDCLGNSAQGKGGNLHKSPFIWSLYAQNETVSHLFNAECSKVPHYHLKYMNLGHRGAPVSPKQQYF